MRHELRWSYYTIGCSRMVVISHSAYGIRQTGIWRPVAADNAGLRRGSYCHTIGLARLVAIIHSAYGLYQTDYVPALFLFRQEKGEKKPTQGALCVLLPQSKPPPCVSPGRIAVGSGAP